MGSDLSTSPPTPDEKRIVVCFKRVAVYTRHTDGIYGDTRTWTRQHSILDTDGAVLKTLKATMPGVKVTTLEGDVDLNETMPFEAFATPDRDWDREEHELTSKINRAKERASLAWEEAAAYEQALAKLRAERKDSK
jgi:hypothetical protein